MVWLNKHASQLIDNNLKRQDKEYYAKIEKFNEEAASLHKKLKPYATDALTPVTQYVNDYISYTNIWQLKFQTNMQNAEVATMQMLHLTCLIAPLPKTFTREWKKFYELQQMFPTLSDFSEQQFELHYERVKKLLHKK